MYYSYLEFRLGAHFPIPNPKAPLPSSMIATHSTGVNLIHFSDRPKEDIRAWRSTIVLGLSDFLHVPFFVLAAPRFPLALVYSLNMYRMIGDERNLWLKSEGRQVGLHLVDARTGVLCGLRRLEPEWMRDLKDICREQLQAYPDFETVDGIIETGTDLDPVEMLALAYRDGRVNVQLVEA